MEKYCKHFLEGRAEPSRSFGGSIIFCREKCPYGNQETRAFDGEDHLICKTKGRKNLRLLAPPLKRIEGLENYFTQLQLQNLKINP